ncbi:hypothetical protein BDR22DRAFT_971553 [Usnea florida]
MQPFVPMPGFTVDQTVYLQAYISTSPLPPLQWPQQCTPPAPQAQKEQIQPLQFTQQSTPPTPHDQKEEGKEKQEPLYQATVEDADDDAESTKHSNSMLTGSKRPGSKTAYLSSALPFAC